MGKGLKGLGSALGGVAGGVFGSAGGPMGTMAGASMGSALGGAVGGMLEPEGENAGDASSQNVAANANYMERQATEDYNKQGANRALYADQLAQGALGKGPSIADAQMKSAQDRTLAQQLAMAKSQRGVNPALAARQAATQGAAASQNIAQQTAIARLQEQRQQQAQYQDYLNQLQQSRGVGLQSGANAAANASAAADRAQGRQDNMMGTLLNTGAQLAGHFATSGSGAGASTPSGGGTGLLGANTTFDYKAAGGIVDGAPAVPGDSIKNDVVPTKLSPDEMVIPRSVVEAGPSEIKNFAAELLRRSKSSSSAKNSEPKSFGAVLAAKAHLSDQLQELDKKHGKGI